MKQRQPRLEEHVKDEASGESQMGRFKALTRRLLTVSKQQLQAEQERLPQKTKSKRKK